MAYALSSALIYKKRALVLIKMSPRLFYNEPAFS